MSKPRVIRHHLEEFRTVLRLAYDEPTWAALRAAMGDHPDLSPNAPQSASGSVQCVMWHPLDDSDDHNPKRIQHLVIWIDQWEGRRTRANGDVADLVGTVAHEAAHVVQWIAQFIGEGASHDGRMNEWEAYLAGFVARWVWDNLP